MSAAPYLPPEPEELVESREPWRWNVDRYYRAYDLGIFGESRLELVDGEVYPLSPQSGSHMTAVGRLLRWFPKVLVASQFLHSQMPLRVNDSTELEPDFAVLRDEPEVQPPSASSALLVVEVSQTSLAFDRGPKREIYARCAIPEYWIVNLAARRLEVYREPQGEEYTVIQYLDEFATASPLFNPEAQLEIVSILPKP